MRIFSYFFLNCFYSDIPSVFDKKLLAKSEARLTENSFESLKTGVGFI